MLDLLNRYSVMLVFPAVALGVFIGALFYFYRGNYDAPPSPVLEARDIPPVSSSFTTYSETPVIREGTLLVDADHNNGYLQPEISNFLSKVSARGFDVEFLGNPNASGRLSSFSSFGSSSILGSTGKASNLEERLRSAHSFLVIQPARGFSQEEIEAVYRFVREKGGRLVLIADPSRNHNINPLAERFGITFRSDYLYNQVEYDLNFQNVYIRDFRPGPLTEGLNNIVLYSTGSIESAGGGLAVSDGNTRSTFVEGVEPLYPIVTSEGGNVLAVADLTFLIPPQSTILDNPRLVSNLADFLASDQRRFDLDDFPHFFGSTAEIILGRESLLEAGVRMKGVLAGSEVASEIRKIEDPSRDLVFLGLYEDAYNVAQYLQLAGVGLDNELRTPFTPATDKIGTAVAVLHQSEERQVLVILGDSVEDVARVLGSLESGGFRDGLVGDFIGVY